MKKIKILNLNYGYENTLFDNLNLEIKSKTLNTLIGPNGSGKTTLSLILAGLIKTDNVYFDEEKANNKELNKKIIYINEFSKIKKVKIVDEKINKIIKPILNKKNKTKQEQVIINILMSISEKPELLILDDVLSIIDNKQKIIEIIKKEKITLINITNNIEESLYTDNIIILNNKKIIINSKKEKVLEQEKLLKENNISLPFMVDLSNKLKFYNLIEEPILDMDEMVDKLWK